MPSVEASLASSLVFIGEYSVVKYSVMRMFQLTFLYSLIIPDQAVTKKLNLGHLRQRRKVASDDRFFGTVLCTMTISVHLRFEPFRNFILSLG